MKHERPDLQKLLEDQVADMFYAEKQLLEALSRMAEAARDRDLARTFADHRRETETHVRRLEQVFSALELPTRTRTCPAMDGLLEEADELLSTFKDTGARDAALIAAAQKIEHYEIATYGTLAALGDQLGLSIIARELRATLHEEKDADHRLSLLANACNPVAAL